MTVNKNGMAGENAAALFLKKKGLEIVARNFETKIGEIDIIAFQSKKSAEKQAKKLAKLLKNDQDENERIETEKALNQKEFETKDVYLIFVEVKSRTSDEIAKPEQAVNERKRAKIVQIAEQFVQKNKFENVQMRFDIIEVLGKQINHIEGAF